VGEAVSVGELFEFLLAEWHLPADYILDNWTDELLDLMVEKLVARKQREARIMRSGPSGTSERQKVPDSVLFARAKNLVKVVKK